MRDKDMKKGELIDKFEGFVDKAKKGNPLLKKERLV